MLCGYRKFHCIHNKENIYKYIAEDVEITFYTSNYKLDRPLAKGKTKK